MSDNEFKKQKPKEPETNPQGKEKPTKKKHTQELFKLTSIVYNVNSLEIW